MTNRQRSVTPFGLSGTFDCTVLLAAAVRVTWVYALDW
ncbi:hypothetical protein Sinac_5469 [Singulisphaera acidiphila DSM 18658]|uniref:Uncharacterized protein n=1 Tax=Singulisphaera acidiphila (strain ATCC BAA-1392 / DSM 18658 / VKM B-2454 / MOB10) TaxID=886293 RepID=L0DLA9_SINAD|nr:hypothetical protein Sinac_5469 [Singulisphaera acidiphila DSM 18658]